MNKKTYTLNTLLTAVLATVLAAMVILRAVSPQLILMQFDIVSITGICLIALVLDHYLAPGAKRCYICIPVFAALSFGILPLAAGMVAAGNALGLAASGAAIFTVCAWTFTSVQDRISSGPAAKLAPVMSALGIWLAVQAFAGIGF
jgi:hypothetical protein